jgi:ATP adenylyltransferase
MTQVNMRHVRTEAQRQLYERVQESGVCSFCEDFCRGKTPTFHPNPIIRDLTYWALTECFPKIAGAKEHFLVVSKFLDEEGHHLLFPVLPKEAWAELGELIEWVTEEYQLPGGAFFFRFGDTDYTGASVSHLHGQIVCGGATAGERLRVKLGYTG